MEAAGSLGVMNSVMMDMAGELLRWGCAPPQRHCPANPSPAGARLRDGGAMIISPSPLAPAELPPREESLFRLQSGQLSCW